MAENMAREETYVPNTITNFGDAVMDDEEVKEETGAQSQNSVMRHRPRRNRQHNTEFQI